MTNGWDMISPQSLFTTQEDRDAQNIGTLRELYVSEVIPFKNHTFKVLEDDKMQELMDSISEHGILEPCTAFTNENGEIELISGHRRQHACELLGIEAFPVLVKNITRDEAIITMGESNLQSRDEILPSEKGFTYKAMYEAIKRQGKRNDLTSSPLETKSFGGRSDDELAGKSKDSRAQIQRYIRITNLIPGLLDLVDAKRIGMRPAVELSYLPTGLQKYIFDIYETEEITPSHAQARKMRALLNENLLDEEKITEIMREKKANQNETFKISYKIVDKFLNNCKSNVEKENRIIKALELLEKQEKIQGNVMEQDSFLGQEL